MTYQVSDPGESQGDGWEDTGTDKECCEVANGGGADEGQEYVANSTDAAEYKDEGPSLANTVGNHAHAHADKVCGDIWAGREALCVDRSMPHILQDSREISRQRAKRGVEAKDDECLHVVLVVVERSKDLSEVELSLRIFSATLDGALADDFVLSRGEEPTL